VAVVVALYSGIWFVLEYMLLGAVNQELQQFNERGMRIDCENLRKKGYPLRFGLTCDSLHWRDGAGRYDLAMGAIVATAPIYAPSWRTVELGAPVLLDLVDLGRVEALWRHLTLTADFIDEVPGDVSLAIEEFELNLTAIDDAVSVLLQADFMRLQLAKEAAEIKLNLSFDALRLFEIMNNRQTPATTGELVAYFDPPPAWVLDAALSDGGYLLPLTRGISGRLEKLSLHFLSGGSLLLDGDFHIDDFGTVSGQFRAHMLEMAALLRTARHHFPDQSSNLGTLFFVLNTMPKDETGNPIVTINIEEGRIRAGFIPLGHLPSF